MQWIWEVSSEPTRWYGAWQATRGRSLLQDQVAQEDRIGFEEIDRLLPQEAREAWWSDWIAEGASRTAAEFSPASSSYVSWSRWIHPSIDSQSLIDRIEQNGARKGGEATERPLELRSRPIRELWDGYGRALVRRVERGAGCSVGDRPVQVWLLMPHTGGGGWASMAPHWTRIDQPHLADRIAWEAMLTNSNPKLPELLRLLWLGIQPSLWRQGLPCVRHTQTLHDVRLTRDWLLLAAAAMVPMVLEAGESLELSGPAGELLEPALAAWWPPAWEEPFHSGDRSRELAIGRLAELVRKFWDRQGPGGWIPCCQAMMAEPSPGWRPPSGW
ncbi:MAG: hypothetical protein ACKN94_13340 [Pirellulaceae bacterium]